VKHNPLKLEAATFLSQKSMGLKRKLKDGLNPPAKHRYSLRSKSKCKQFELENFCSRFPHLSEDILGELDYKSLVKFKEVGKFGTKISTNKEFIALGRLSNVQKSLQNSKSNGRWL
jgi:hypothetical protein